MPYAVTINPSGKASWRAVGSVDDLVPGETFAEEPPTPSLAEVKIDLCLRIDASADSAYAAIGGPSPGRLAEYKQAKADADALKAADYSGTVPDTIACWAEARGWTAQQACDDILSTAASWEAALAMIRRQRLIGKKNVNLAIDAAAAESAAELAIATIRSVPAGAG